MGLVYTKRVTNANVLCEYMGADYISDLDKRRSQYVHFLVHLGIQSTRSLPCNM